MAIPKFHPQPTAFIDWLKAELDIKLASLPDDEARHLCLILNRNQWLYRYRRFVDVAEQPFDKRHPKFGDMDAWDFSLLIADIDRRMTELVRKKVSA